MVGDEDGIRGGRHRYPSRGERERKWDGVLGSWIRNHPSAVERDVSEERGKEGRGFCDVDEKALLMMFPSDLPS